ncbi:FecR family protein [Pseudobacter ginsenosidimutans]|uniref:FecR family protein n=1 Tax=Pseudobacter ginsenosidimutans TaxID=661488 RepID=A0A4Q7N1A6_9BACT|nr:FecR family protein [Pseudobacter ginsenosidimutans]QEC43957.1 DUF4974 domain-containing protein [Pseudobacter ginsenosidimutans]RZS75390.1 FecR family protein [Pseudobacter ginsenosidimutans]
MEHRIDHLLNKLSENSATEADWNELLDAIRNDHSGEVIAGIEQFKNRKADVKGFDPETPEWDDVFKRAVAADKPEQSATGKLRRIHIMRWTAAAAVVLLSLVSVLYFLLPENKQVAPTNKQITIINPGSEGAVLTLADGVQMVIDTTLNGVVAAQNGSEVVVADGAMRYRPQEGKQGLVEYNTMTTPTGKQFQFTLPDGTKVWLNAASSIKYPTSFKGNTREVEVSGEAYFDVTHNAKQPFIVQAGKDARIEVLGTSFNVNAYPDEQDIRTTLESGLVMIRATGHNRSANTIKETLLKPGQQAVVAVLSNGSKEKGITINTEVKIEKVTAWKKGLFNFEGSSLVEVMKELERWYNIEVVYEGAPPTMKFYGKIGKQLPLNDLLEVLDKSKVKFMIEGRKLIVKP